MAPNSKLHDELARILHDGEVVKNSTFAQLKKGNSAKRVAKDIGVSLAVTTATSVVGFGVMRNTVPPQVWVVTTSERLLLFAKPDGHRSLGPLVFDAPLETLTVTDGTKTFGTVLLGDSSTGENIAQLNLGVRRAAARRVVASAAAR